MVRIYEQADQEGAATHMVELPDNVSAFVSPANPLTTEAEAALPNNQVSLITFAQAIHWFHHPLFFATAHRKLQPDSCLAFWCYALFRTGSKELDDMIFWLYDAKLGDKYWSPERKMVEQGYSSIVVPDGFSELPVDYDQIGSMTKTWSYDDLIGYLSTWSAFGKYRDSHNGEYPWDDTWLSKVKERWGGPREVTFDFTLRIFKKV